MGSTTLLRQLTANAGSVPPGRRSHEPLPCCSARPWEGWSDANGCAHRPSEAYAFLVSSEGIAVLTPEPVVPHPFRRTSVVSQRQCSALASLERC